jgi:hypothetical protein
MNHSKQCFQCSPYWGFIMRTSCHIANYPTKLQKRMNQMHYVHGPLGPIFYPINKANIIADFLENQFRVHGLCDFYHWWLVEAQVEALLATVCEDIHVYFWLCDIWKEIQSLKLRKARGFEGIPNESLWYLPRRSFLHSTHLFNPFLLFGHFPIPWKEANIVTVLKPSKVPKFTPD